MSAANINTAVAAAIAAMRVRDFATAKTELQIAKAELAGTPDAEHNGEVLRWDRSAIDSLITQVDQQLAASKGSGGVQTTKVKYVGATS